MTAIVQLFASQLPQPDLRTALYLEPATARLLQVSFEQPDLYGYDARSRKVFVTDEIVQTVPETVRQGAEGH